MSREDDAGAAGPEDATVLQEDPTVLQTGEAIAPGEAETVLQASDPEPPGEAPTVVERDEDRTQLVTRPPDAPKATRVLDPAARQPAPDRSPGEETSEGETRLLEERDKTAPPAAAPAAAPAPPTPIDAERGLTPGTVLFGEYEIVNVLGVGGMGEVYRARHRRLDEHRAIKVMHAELSKKKGASEFFYREAKALLAVRHPAVVHCHDLLSDEEGRVYLIMEMIEGIPLSKKMNEGPLSPDDVAILGARVAHGLSAAHRKGVIHRDLSPDNIVLPNGRVQEAKIIDFGIAKILQEGEGTIVDGFKGKLSYASPEQLGFFGGQIDGRSDFYSLGLVLAAAALGRPMGMGTTVMEAVDARRGFEALPDEIPVGLRSAIQPLLALDPKDRPRYVDRLFVVPGGVDGPTDAGGYGSETGARSRAAEPRAGQGGKRALQAGVALAVPLLLGGGLYWSLATGSAPNARSPAIPESEARPFEPQAEERNGAPTASIGDVDPAERIASPQPQPVIERAPEKPRPRRLTASDRIKIIGLLSNAKIALSENRLMSPAGDNAFERYQRVLALDPGNETARQGLRNVADRYLSLADAAVGQGETEQARVYLGRAREADARHPGLEAAEARLRAR